jgi:FkbM family methyltransferase
VCDLSQLWALDEVWVAGEYQPIADGEYELVLDLGANVGAASIWLHERHPRALILAVEPDPRSVPWLRRNTEPFERIRVIHAAVGLAEGIGQLTSDELSWTSHILWDDSPGLAVETDRGPLSSVPVTTIPALLRDAGVTPGVRVLAKVDIEGSEWPLLRTPEALEALSVIYGETHPGLSGAPRDPEEYLAAASRVAGFDQLPAPPEFFHWRRRGDTASEVSH